MRVVSGTHQLEALPTAQTPHVFNFGHEKVRANATQRPPRVPTNVQRLGHIVVQTPKYIEALNWYLDTFGMIVSDFSYYPGQRERGPILSFIRCDRGSVPADHHTLAMALGPVKRYMHSAYRSLTSTRWPPAANTCASKGISARGASAATSKAARSSTTGVIPTVSWSSTIADGDMFDNTLEPGWAPMRRLRPGSVGTRRRARTSWGSERRGKPRANLP